MQHLSTFGLNRDPFANDPQLQYWFAAPTFVEAVERLERAALQRKGLCVVTGRGGVGKTMLVRQLMDVLEEEAFETCALVPVPQVTDGAWFLSRFARQLGVEELADSPADVLGQIYEQLAIVREDGRTAVLILDEASVLAEQGLLPMLRGLLNLEYEERRLVTVVLVGSPELWTAIQDEPSLADRVDLRFELPPLDGEVSAAYLTHRIRAAEGNPAILESGAVQALVKHADGIPRRLNHLADAALFEAHLAGRLSTTATDVERAVVELADETDGVPPLTGRSLVPGEQAPTSASMPAAAPAVAPPAAPDSELDAMFDEPAAPTVELDEVVASPTNPGLQGSPDATVALLSEAPPAPRGAPAETVALFADEPVAPAVAPAPPPVAPAAAPAAPPSAPAETVAILAEPAGAGDGDLDDLFADLVDE